MNTFWIWAKLMEECQWTYLCFLPLLHTLIICTHVLFSSLISSALCYSFQRCTNYELQFFHVIFDKGWSAIWLYVKVFVLHMPQTRTRMVNFRTFRPAFLLKTGIFTRTLPHWSDESTAKTWKIGLDTLLVDQTWIQQEIFGGIGRGAKHQVWRILHV